jgi:hypothetical protein
MAVIVVSGPIANKPHNGGNAWAVLNWVLGLRRLGLQVFLLEQISQETCVDLSGRPAAFRDCANLTYFAHVVEQCGLSGVAALICDHGSQLYGLSYAELLDLADATSLLVNISGHLDLDAVTSRVRRKAFIDLDPGYTQFWHAAGNSGARLEGHDIYFTIGENVGTPDCTIPTAGIRWHHTRQPVVLEYCSPASIGHSRRFRTVASWRGAYGPVRADGRTYGVKAHEFRKFLELPQRAQHEFEIALEIHPADAKDLEALRQHGWLIADPKTTVPDPAAFHGYVAASGAEFSVAQGIYVETNSGWFSDRTIRYLALAKPALVQDTGFSRNYPVGYGLVPFRSLGEAVDGAGRIVRDYDAHCRAARAIAEDYFDSDKVLGRVVELALASHTYHSAGMIAGQEQC